MALNLLPLSGLDSDDFLQNQWVQEAGGALHGEAQVVLRGARLRGLLNRWGCKFSAISAPSVCDSDSEN